MPGTEGVEITGPAGDRYDEILTPEALGLVAALHRELGARRAELLAARDRLWEEFRLAVEPAAAAPLAALLAGQVPGDLPCVILCGANTDWIPA